MYNYYQHEMKPTCLRESRGLRLNLRVLTTTESLILQAYYYYYIDYDNNE